MEKLKKHSTRYNLFYCIQIKEPFQLKVTFPKVNKGSKAAKQTLLLPFMHLLYYSSRDGKEKFAI